MAGYASFIICTIPYNTNSLIHPCRRCPKDFKLGSLEPQHAQLASSHWPVHTDRPTCIRTAYYEHLIRFFDTVALFKTHDPTTPISWLTVHPYGCIGYLYTFEEYRKSALSTLVGSKLGLKVVARGDIPQSLVSLDNRVSAEWTERIGMYELGRRNCLVVK